MSDAVQGPIAQELQFQHAEPLSIGQSCVVCKHSIGNAYFQARGQVICPLCAERIQSGQQAPPAASLPRAILCGMGAALAGCALYATVAIVTGLEIGLVAIVVGILVGKAIRRASHGLGGRPQQILAVGLTYFAITTSYIPVAVYERAQHPESVAASRQSQNPDDGPSSAGALLDLLLLAAAAPFLELGSGVSGIISLFIIFIGLRRAWRLTARPAILLEGPYEAAAG